MSMIHGGFVPFLSFSKRCNFGAEKLEEISKVFANASRV